MAYQIARQPKGKAIVVHQVSPLQRRVVMATIATPINNRLSVVTMKFCQLWQMTSATFNHLKLYLHHFGAMFSEQPSYFDLSLYNTFNKTILHVFNTM